MFSAKWKWSVFYEEMNLQIFTIERPVPVMMESFVSSLQRHGVNCLVDVRNVAVTADDELPRYLKARGIVWLSMREEFGCVHDAVCGGKPKYKQLVAEEPFCRGIERLHDGMNKGFRIAVMDSVGKLEDSFRYAVLGRRLSADGVVVWHIGSGGRAVRHSVLTERALDKKRYDLEKAHLSAELGKTGEDIAVAYLEEKGYDIVDRNWTLHKGGEIDIVARRGRELHFVEVKTRSSQKYGMPQQAIGFRKMRHLYKAMQDYLRTNRLYGIVPVMDSVSIVMRSAEDYDIDMFENIEYVENRYY